MPLSVIIPKGLFLSEERKRKKKEEEKKREKEEKRKARTCFSHASSLVGRGWRWWATGEGNRWWATGEGDWRRVIGDGQGARAMGEDDGRRARANRAGDVRYVTPPSGGKFLRENWVSFPSTFHFSSFFLSKETRKNRREKRFFFFLPCFPSQEISPNRFVSCSNANLKLLSNIIFLVVSKQNFMQNILLILYLLFDSNLLASSSFHINIATTETILFGASHYIKRKQKL